MDKETFESMQRAAIQPQIIDIDSERKIAILPDLEGRLRVEDLSKFLPPPSRIRQAVTLLNVESFLDYVNKYRTSTTTVFANEVKASYKAVIDYHSATETGRGNQDHKAFYECPLSDQWQTWTGLNERLMDQVAFAQFLENNLVDITAPPAAQFLSAALNLQMHKDAEFLSEVNLDNGTTKFRYEEQIRDTKKAGDISIPSTFKITIPVFVDGPKYAIEARFRFRIDDKHLKMHYQLIRWKDVWNEAVKDVTKEITEGLEEGVSVYAGTANGGTST